MNQQIFNFIQQNTCANICCINAIMQPYCFTCYYLFNSTEQLLYYKSTLDTAHSVNILAKSNIAGTILPDKLNKLKVKGVQFEGIVLDNANPMVKRASIAYHKKYPMALAVPGNVWVIQLNHIKYTNNALGFGKKLHWIRLT
ncbi:MAG: hypothetical protein Q8K64_10515 [Sediminibacterium sp.]|nr:hypothetical protein [Sediminibacterium sp.]TXT32706.1 MAG: hypothetical protein FD136_1261 [Chitinophagaceae bacterium]